MQIRISLKHGIGVSTMNNETSLQSTFPQMRRRQWYKIILGVVLVDALILFMIYLLFGHIAGVISYPPSAWLGHWYFDAIVRNDSEGAASLLATCNKKNAD